MDRKPGDLILHLRPLPSPVPVGRLAQLLKVAGRALDLKCVEALEVSSPTAGEQAPPPANKANP
jgi:hypothetical protein